MEIHHFDGIYQETWCIFQPAMLVCRRVGGNDNLLLKYLEAWHLVSSLPVPSQGPRVAWTITEWMQHPGIKWHTLNGLRQPQPQLGGGLKHFLFSPLLGEMIQFWRAYVSKGLKPPTRQPPQQNHNQPTNQPTKLHCCCFFPTRMSRWKLGSKVIGSVGYNML